MSILFHLVRHGRTSGNDDNLYRGWSNAGFAQLDESGKQDAKDAGIYLRGLGVQPLVILVDDLERTQETAKIVAEILGIKEIITDKRLRPVDVGDYTGQNKAKYPLDEFMADPKKKIPGGSSLDAFNKVQAKVFGDVIEAIVRVRKELKKPDATFLIIGHGSNTSFLYHTVNKGGKEVGYEGMTEPGGILTFDNSGIQPIFKAREKKDKSLPLYPKEHLAAMPVPKGGSSCSKCEYLGKDKKTCTQKDFIEWEGPNKPSGSDVIPEAIDSYCSDWFIWKKKED